MLNWYVIYLFCAVTLSVVVVNSEEESNAEGGNTSRNKFKSVPTTVKTFENDTVLLPCYLENAGTSYHVRWLKDKILIADSSDHELLPPDRVRMHSNHSLQVTRLTPNDTGEYVCEVIRPEPWSPIRQVHAIEVLYPPEVVSIPEVGMVHVRVGEEVDMACKAKGVPQPAITWNFNGNPIELVVNRDRLRFNATSRHLSGNYECLATNGVGDTARATIKLVINHPPVVWSDNAWIHTSTGVRSVLECHVAASPVARVHWFHGQQPVRLSSRLVARVREHTHSLLLRNVRDQDLGAYTCKAENRLGMAELHLHLSGVANIAVFKSDQSKNNPTQTTYTLIWEVDSYSPIIEFNLWFRPYKPRPPQKEGVFIIKEKDDWTKMIIPGESNEGPVHTAFYVLRGLTPATAYEALVTSRNRFGWSKPSSVYHFFTLDRVTENKSSENSMLPPTVEVFENDITKTNTSNIFATSGLIDDILTVPASQETMENSCGHIHVTLTNFLFTLTLSYVIYL